MSKAKTSTGVTKTNAKPLTTEYSVAKHGVIYDTESTSSNNNHEDMKILHIVSGIIAELGFMHFRG